MAVPLSYIARNLWTRRVTTALTAGGLALVVFVFATVLMLDAGLRQTLVATGEYDNVVAIRKGAGTEIQSGITRPQAAIIETHPAVAAGADGRPLASKETVVLIALKKSGAAKPSNVVIRGISGAGFSLRPQVRIVEGRAFTPGSTEIVVGAAIARGFEGVRIGERLHFAQRDWTIVGVFDAGASGFDSEIWGDADQLMQAFRRIVYSSVIIKLRDADDFERMRADVDADPRLSNEVKRERVFYSDQSKALSTFISVLGLTLTAVFSIGAMLGAMITMYASVANRVGEIGTLRALGFSRRSILASFLIESMFLALVGGALGCLLAFPMNGFTTGTGQTASFSEIAFAFRITAGSLTAGMIFALVMGFLGGLLPGLRAARLPITAALRET